jgi:hypothetical protein
MWDAVEFCFILVSVDPLSLLISRLFVGKAGTMLILL